MNRHLITALKIAASAAILGFLLLGPGTREAFSALSAQSMDFGLLAAATAFCVLMVVATIVRWYLLVRALDLPFRLRDAFRLGFLAYALNFVSLGNVGGDLFKAIFIAREQPGRRAEAVATVVIDRIIGLYALFVVASCTILVTGLWRSQVLEIQVIARSTLLLTAVGAVGIGLVLMPGFTGGWMTQRLLRLPKAGPVAVRLLTAVRIYRSKLPVLGLAFLISIGVHCCTTLGTWLAAQGLSDAVPSLASHLVIVPLAVLAGALPLPLGGLGGPEFVQEFLYTRLAGGVAVAAGTGLIVALAWRAISIVVAAVGFVYYLANRTLVAQLRLQVESASRPALDLPADHQRAVEKIAEREGERLTRQD